MTSIHKIQGQVQNYAWGGSCFIPELIGFSNPDNTACAEYWLGIHPAAPALIADTHHEQTLQQFIAENEISAPQFLLKVLDVKEMLSIQVHPTPEQAKAGYAKENKLGISLNAKNRNYKDVSDKPELALALSEFWLLHGFRSLEEIKLALQNKLYLKPLLQIVDSQGLKRAFETALNDNDASVKTMHKALYEDVIAGKYQKNQIEFWIQRWIRKNPDTLNGILTLYMLNLVKLEKGEAIYQPSGLLHAYLEGQNIELMANSDNVLRAGLTPKHIDVPELLKIANIAPSNTAEYIISPQRANSYEQRFPTPFKEFELSEISTHTPEFFHWQAKTSEILLCIEGDITFVETQSDHISSTSGDAYFIPPGTKVTITSENCRLFRARNLA